MKVIICIDERGGVRFHDRRVSQDVAQRRDVIARYGKDGLLMRKETAALYAGETDALHVVDDWEQGLGQDGWWVCEDTAFLRWEEQLEEVILYRWNRRYPSDEVLRLCLSLPLWRCVAVYDLPGKSHARIDVEHYVKGRNQK